MKRHISETSLLYLPEEERPFEKLEQFGPQALTDAELLAVLIRTGTQSANALSIAREICHISAVYPGLLGLYHCTKTDLTNIRGVGDVRANQILCLAELSRRLAKTAAQIRLDFNRPSSIADHYMEDMRHLDTEKLRLLSLDSKNRLLQDKTISSGTVSMAPASPREIFREALLCGAVHVILLHNHPSGDPTPSFEDLEITERLTDIGNMLGIPLLDHIIIGDRRYTSIREYTNSSLYCKKG